MGRSRNRFYEEHYPYFVTSMILDELPLFTKPGIAKILLKELIYLQEERKVILYAWVIMGNHFHAIAQGSNLSKKLRLTKSYTARQILEYLKVNGHKRWLDKLKSNKRRHKTGSTYQLWEEGLHPIQLSTHKMMYQKVEYIHGNPVKSGFVESPLHWRYSSASAYQGLPGLIPVTLFRG